MKRLVVQTVLLNKLVYGQWVVILVVFAKTTEKRLIYNGFVQNAEKTAEHSQWLLIIPNVFPGGFPLPVAKKTVRKTFFRHPLGKGQTSVVRAPGKVLPTIFWTSLGGFGRREKSFCCNAHNKAFKTTRQLIQHI